MTPQNEVPAPAGKSASGDAVSAPVCSSCGQPRPVGSWPYCQDSTGRHGHTRGGGGNLIVAFHASERTVVYCHPGKTGRDRYRQPARNDQPVPEVYARQGYVRMELESPRDVAAYEKETGLIHERSWCDPGSGTAERSLQSGLEEPKISGLDRAYGDRELLTSIPVSVKTA